MAIRFPAAAMVVGYVSREGRGLFAVIIVLVVTVPSPPLTTQIPTTARQESGGWPGGFNWPGVLGWMG